MRANIINAHIHTYINTYTHEHANIDTSKRTKMQSEHTTPARPNWRSHAFEKGHSNTVSRMNGNNSRPPPPDSSGGGGGRGRHWRRAPAEARDRRPEKRKAGQKEPMMDATSRTERRTEGKEKQAAPTATGG